MSGTKDEQANMTEEDSEQVYPSYKAFLVQAIAVFVGIFLVALVCTIHGMHRPTWLILDRTGPLLPRLYLGSRIPLTGEHHPYYFRHYTISPFTNATQHQGHRVVWNRLSFTSVLLATLLRPTLCLPFNEMALREFRYPLRDWICRLWFGAFVTCTHHRSNHCRCGCRWDL